MSLLKLALLAPALVCEAAYRPAMLGRAPAAFESVAARLELALGEPVDMVRVHVADSGYDFARNLAATGPRGGMVTSDPKRLAHFGQGQDVSTAALRSAFAKMNIKVQSLDFAVNFANLAFDRELDLLVMAMPAPLEPSCTWVHPTLGCETQMRKLHKAFGSPANVIKFEPEQNMPQPGVPAGKACYDLDTYFFMLRNERGEPVVLLHDECVKEAPSSRAAQNAGSVGRLEVKARLEGMGVTVVKVSREDFLRRACNAVSPEAGRVVFSEAVSESLRKSLMQLGVNSTSLHDFARGREFGIHCLTLEIPGSGNEEL